MKNLNFLLLTSLTMLICLTALSGCSIIRKLQIESELEQLNPQKELSQRRLDGFKQNISTLQSQSNKLTNDLRANHNATMTFIRNHPGVVACIASGVIVIDEGNVFSKDVKELGAGIGLICIGIYLFNEDFQKSVDNFLEELDESSKRAKNLQSQIDSLKPRITAETRVWQTEKNSFDELSEKIIALEIELNNLKRTAAK